jgi:hypothetical protein
VTSTRSTSGRWTSRRTWNVGVPTDRQRRLGVEPVPQLVAVEAAGQHGYLDGSALRRRYKVAQKAAKLRPLRFHDLRHTFGSLAGRMNVRTRELQEWMGQAHSLALHGDGTVVAWGCGSGFDHGECTMPGGLSGVSAIAAGDHHSLALVELADQTIDFDPLPNKVLSDPDFTVNARASSGLPISFAASGNCAVIGSTVVLTGVGQCTISASQAGNARYNAAPGVSRSFLVAERPPSPAPPRPQ